MPKVPLLTATGSGGVTLGQPGIQRLPSPSAEQAGGAIGAGLQQLGVSLQALDKRLQDQRDRIWLSEAHLNYTVASKQIYQDLLSNPEIPFEQKPERLMAQLEDLRDKFHEQALTVSSDAAIHWLQLANERIGTDQIQMMTDARQFEIQSQIVRNDKSLEDQISYAALLPREGPDDASATVDSLFMIARDTLDGQVQNGIRHPVEAEKVKKLLMDRYYTQFAENHPEQALRLMAKGSDRQMDPARKTHYEQVARTVMAIRDQEEERRLRLARRKLEQEQRDTQNAFLDLLDKDELTVDMVLRSNLEPVGVGSKEHYYNLLQAKEKEKGEKRHAFQKNPALFAKTLESIRSGELTQETDLENIYIQSANRNSGISWEDLKELRGELADFRTPDGRTLGSEQKKLTDGVKGQITKSVLGKLDSRGDQLFVDYTLFVRGKVREKREKKEDPYVLFEVGHPEYLGAESVLRRYQRTMTQIMEDMTRDMGFASTPDTPTSTPPPASPAPPAASGVLPRQPGETPAEWEKRKRAKQP